jgi:hypothetical protein
MEDVGIFGLFDGHLAIFYGFLLYFIVIWCIIPVWVSFCKKNLATLLSAAAREREKKRLGPNLKDMPPGHLYFVPGTVSLIGAIGRVARFYLVQ